jgi:hypothetical protein
MGVFLISAVLLIQNHTEWERGSLPFPQNLFLVQPFN